MKKVKGDLIALALEGEFDVIVHGCNCQCVMGKGIAKTIKTRFPAAYQADLKTKKGDRDKLGTISFATVDSAEQKLTIVNAYTQFDWRGKGSKVDYEAIKSCFTRIKDKFSGLRIGYPAIGAGLAGGDWNRIAATIDEVLKGEDHTFVEFEKG
uniref:Macro domain-containing protein n=1 Tax=Roseihalotalea indica TaxID=2867963 RepID=A0AA49JHU7_9BACT|nr:macro domain-containing protein [Tunicatimonas sp. TK19036]